MKPFECKEKETLREKTWKAMLHENNKHKKADEAILISNKIVFKEYKR